MKKTVILVLILACTFVSCKKEKTDPYRTDNSGNFTDDRDGQVYKWVKIGDQIWMAENLRSTKYSNGDDIGTTDPFSKDITGEETPKYQWAFNSNETSVSKSGRLYTWFSATDSRNICPTGWHLPSDEEWTTMQNYLIHNGYSYTGNLSDNKIAKALSASDKWDISTETGVPGNTDYPEYINKSGFSAIPAGYRALNGNFIGDAVYAYWWVNSENNDSKACGKGIHCDTDTVRSDFFTKKYGFSVRCLKD